jgi:hypothetical protein
MSVVFHELAGSPIERYTSSGFIAERHFIINWADRDAFAVALLGEAAEHGGSSSTHYPGKETVFAKTIRYEPLDPELLDEAAQSSLTEGLNSYSKSFAKAIVTYQTMSKNDRSDISNEPGTHLTYEMFYGGEHKSLTATGWNWLDTSLAIPSTEILQKWVPMTEHNMSWHQVVNPPWETIQTMQGKVNSTTFLGAPAGTVLFEGARANKLYQAGYDEGSAPFCWKIEYMFREKAIKHGTSTYGWNHAYRGNPAGWVELINTTGDKLYASADFTQLFISAT